MKKFEIKIDCFAFNGKNCSALRKLYCEKEECNFYKSKEDYKKETKKLEG